mgnify:CR=1 FL=1
MEYTTEQTHPLPATNTDMTTEAKPKRGRKPTPAHLKREQCNFRLAAWVRDWLVAQPDDAGPLIEAALIDRHKLKPPKV